VRMLTGTGGVAIGRSAAYRLPFGLKEAQIRTRNAFYKLLWVVRTNSRRATLAYLFYSGIES
jgi:hypothetical protein